MMQMDLTLWTESIRLCLKYYVALFKEQSHCPSVLLAQTKPEGLPEGFKPPKHKGKGIVPIITHGRFCWV